jgi:uncharacterized protein YdaU (DUF1376 family)
MTVRPTWFRCDPGKLLGALGGMKPDVGYLYTIILMRIYEVGGPISDDEAMLSRRTGLTAKRITAGLAWLIQHGKVERLQNGRLDSVTTHEELSFREKTIKHAEIAGKASSKRRQTFNAEKHQSLQQNEATGVQRGFNEGATQAQRASTRARVLDKEVDIELEERELSNDSSYREADASLVNEGEKPPVVDPPAKPKKPKEDLLFLGEQWNALAAALSLPAIDEIEPGSTRERHALARLRKMPGQDGIRELMARIRGSPYLRGEVNGFRVTFDWIVNPTNYQKIMEGNYEDRKIPNRRR